MVTLNKPTINYHELKITVYLKTSDNTKKIKIKSKNRVKK